jgi:hypothetical protein
MTLGRIYTMRKVKWNLFGSAHDVASWFWRHKGHVVGITEQPEDCPLASYLKENRPGIHDVSVGDVYTTYTNSKGETVQLENPQWVGKFVRRVDAVCGQYIYDDLYGEEEFDPAVTGREALDVLKKVTNNRV